MSISRIIVTSAVGLIAAICFAFTVIGAFMSIKKEVAEDRPFGCAIAVVSGILGLLQTALAFWIAGN
jgi:hypothetical protein